MKKILLTSMFFVLALSFSISHAQQKTTVTSDPNKTTVTTDEVKKANQTNQPPQKLQNPLKVNSIQGVILLAVDIMIYVGIAFAILAIIFVGFKFVLAQGKPEEIKKAREWLLYIIIGLAVLISARVIVEIVQNTLIKSGVVNEGLWKP